MSIVKTFVPGFVADGGTSPADACDTHNQMLRRGNVMWAQTGARRRVEVFCVGDSLAAQMGSLTGRSALWWSMALHNLAVTFQGRGALGVGTSTSGNAGGNGNPQFGMTSPERLASASSAIAASVAEGNAPLAIMSVQTNDNYAADNGQSGALSTIANVEKWLLYMLPFGLSHLVIDGGGPSATGGANSLRTRGVCLAYRALAEKYRGLVTFVDNSELLANNTVAYTALGGQTVYGAVMQDDLHPSDRGAWLRGTYTLGPALLALTGTRTRLLGWIGDRYDASLNSRGPLMGDQTRYGGAPITIPAGTLSGTLAIEQADVPDPIAAAMGRPDIIARRLRFSGTPSDAGQLTVQRIVNNPAGYSPVTIPFMPEANLYADITNMKAPNFGWVSGGVGGQAGLDCDVIPRLQGLLTMYAGAPITEGSNFGNRSTSLTFRWIGGKEVAGDLILISASDYAQPPLPLAST